VVVSADRHPVFGRRGKDLTLTVPVSFPEAALGATITVPTLNKPVKLKVPAGTKSGRTFRVKGQGVPASSGAGDLLVTVEVAVPSKLNDAERDAIRALADASGGSTPRAHLGV
jgi:molecular chaperone DnaJ